MKNVWKRILCLVLAVTMLALLPAQTAKADSGTIEDFVTRLYTLCLNRTPDEDGLSDWCTLLSDGSYTGTQVAHGFVFSDEFIATGYSDEEFVQQMYRIFLGREYDQEGMETWLGLMQNSGYGREAIFNGFSQSVEFGGICAEYGIEQGGAVGKVADDISSFVIRFYQVFLGRGADPSGLQTWTTALKDKTMSASEVAQGFVFSDEFLSKNYDDASFVKYMYTAFLDRGADEEGLQTWTECLKNGWTREQVFDGFVDSNEFARICEEYGISPEEPEVPSDGEESEKVKLELSVDTFEIKDSIYKEYEKADGSTGILSYDSKCLFGTYSWSREWTEEERANAFHSGSLFDEKGAFVSLPEYFEWSGGIFAAKLPKDFANGTYTYELTWHINGEEISDTYTFVYDMAEPTYAYRENADGTITITSVKANGVTSIVMPNQIDGKTVTTIGFRSFSDEFSDPSLANVTELVLPDTLEKIEYCAFYGCRSLTELTIPARVTSLDEHMFSSPLDGLNALDIKAVYVEEGNQNYCSVDGVLFSKDMKTLYYLPKDYQASSYEIPEGVETVYEYTSNNLESISLPSSVSRMGNICTGKKLEKYVVDAGNPVYSTVDGVLVCRTTLMAVPTGNSRTEYIVPDFITVIGDYAFWNCTDLIRVEIPASVTIIGEGAFDNCANVVIYTKEGSVADTYAQENGFTVQYQ